MRTSIRILYLFVFFATASCRPFFNLVDKPDDEVLNVESQSAYYTIDESIVNDPEIDEFLQPSREIVSSVMDRVITAAEAPFEIRTPESTLGNLAADILRFGAAREYRGFVHLGLINIDALRIELPAGSVTLGDIFQMIPFEEKLVILELTGSQVVQLAHEIAQRGGAPVSGMRMGISEGRARGLLVNAEVVDESQSYYLATTESVVNGAGGFESIQNHGSKVDYPLLVRDMFIDYFGSRYRHEPALDQRIRIQ